MPRQLLLGAGRRSLHYSDEGSHPLQLQSIWSLRDKIGQRIVAGDAGLLNPLSLHYPFDYTLDRRLVHRCFTARHAKSSCPGVPDPPFSDGERMDPFDLEVTQQSTSNAVRRQPMPSKKVWSVF